MVVRSRSIFAFHRARLPWLGFQKEPDSVVGCSACKWGMPRKQMVKHRAQSIDIVSLVTWLLPNACSGAM